MTEMIIYTMENCGPCKMMKPVLEQLRQEYSDRLMITEVDVDQNQQAAITAGIRSVPTIFIYKNGIKIDQQIGAAPKSTLVAKMKL